MKQTVKAHRMMILANNVAITVKRQKLYSEACEWSRVNVQGFICIVRKDKDQ